MSEGADGTQGGRSRKRIRWIVAAAVGAVVLLVALLPMPGILLRRRERAAARHVEALGGRFHLRDERLVGITLTGTKVADADPLIDGEPVAPKGTKPKKSPEVLRIEREIEHVRSQMKLDAVKAEAAKAKRARGRRDPSGLRLRPSPD